MSSITSPRGSNQDGSIEPYLVISGQNIKLLEYLPDGRHIVTGSWDGTIAVWNLESGKQEGGPMEHRKGMFDLAVTRDGTKIVSIDWDGRIKVWDVESHKLVKEWTHPEYDPNIAISPEGLVAIGRENVDICTMEGRHINSIEVGHRIWSRCTCFSPDGSKLACAIDEDIHVYDVNSGRLVGTVDGFVTAVLWSRDGSRLFGSGDDICCWNSDTGQRIGHPWTVGMRKRARRRSRTDPLHGACRLAPDDVPHDAHTARHV